ncbi:MAG TPA: hypothetical protein VMB50_09230 [Myxococcales bacterium]|nr:hypothetical protein [Myxococcales bacterium]
MRTLWLSIGLAAAAAACSSDVCSQLQSLNWGAIQGSCADAGAPPSGSGSCEASLSACSSADQSTLGGYLSCLQRLPACTASNAADWAQADVQCQKLRQTLSSTCPFYLTGGTSRVGGGGPGDGGCTLDDQCIPVQCPCVDVDGGSSTFQQCRNGGCNPTCPAVFCCEGLDLSTGAQCNSPCDCSSSVCAAGSCS